MIEPWLIAVAVILVIAVPFDWVVAGMWLGLAVVKPRIEFVVVTAKRHVIYAIFATVAGILGLHSILFAAYGIRILPAPTPTLLIVLIAVGLSIPNLLSLRYLRDAGEQLEEARELP